MACVPFRTKDYHFWQPAKIIWVNRFIIALNHIEMEDRNMIWEDYFERMSEMDRIISIINYFVYLKDDEFVNEFPLESYQTLQKALQTAEELLKTEEYSNSDIFRYKNCIDDGYRVLNTSTILKPIDITHEQE